MDQPNQYKSLYKPIKYYLISMNMSIARINVNIYRIRCLFDSMNTKLKHVRRLSSVVGGYLIFFFSVDSCWNQVWIVLLQRRDGAELNIIVLWLFRAWNIFCKNIKNNNKLLFTEFLRRYITISLKINFKQSKTLTLF